MQEMAPWKFSLLGGVLAIFLPSLPAWSQQDGATAGASARSYYQFGIANGTKGDLNGAIAAFNQALQIDPKYLPAYYSRGFAREKQKDDEGALADFNRAIELDANYWPALYERGTLKGKAGDFDAAVADFVQVIKLNPKYAPAYYNLGHVYYFQGKLDDAIDQLTQGLSLQPDYALGYWVRGLARHAEGHRTEAQADFQKSAGLYYSYAAFWTWISQIENGQRGIARQNLTDALANPELFTPDDWTSQIANFLLEKITQDQLVVLAGQGDPADTKDRLCEAWFYAGMVKHFDGDDKGARECYTKSVATEAKGSEEYVEANRRLAD
jgi:tetratricopeptide (TPR) repeat protein